MGTATAGSQGPGVSVAPAGTATGQVTETVSASSVSLMLAGAASMSPDSVIMASAGTGSLTPSGHVSVVSAGAGSVAGLGTVTPLRPEYPLVSSLQSEGDMSERDGSQRVTMASPKVSTKGMSSRRHSQRREGQARRQAEKEGSGGQRRSSRRAVTSREMQKSSHQPGGSRHSPSSHKATSRSPSVKDSRTAHKPRKNKDSASIPLTASTKKLSRIASLLRSFSRSIRKHLSPRQRGGHN
ncbi:protein FAM71B-like isoform X2 [Vombatus ursinus]|uniref:protein FAM71B-like isoform X2 n=1 Tax=Vombatus ursinus TaxID=29139 RepID=UPI000FFD5F17|nr:protein FAM71B-like isoform X2 [Vombatus ursinus]